MGTTILQFSYGIHFGIRSGQNRVEKWMTYTEFMQANWYFDAERFKFVMTDSTKCYAKDSTGIDTVCYSDDCIILTYSRMPCFWNIFIG